MEYFDSYFDESDEDTNNINGILNPITNRYDVNGHLYLDDNPTIPFGVVKGNLIISWGVTIDKTDYLPTEVHGEFNLEGLIENFTNWEVDNIGSIKIYTNGVNRNTILPLLEHLIVERGAISMSDVSISPIDDFESIKTEFFNRRLIELI